MSVAIGLNVITAPSNETKGINARRVLLAGVFDQFGPDWNPLPNVKQEIDEIEQSIGGDVLFNEAFTPKAFEQRLQQKQYDIVHLATHAKFEASAQGSYLVAKDSAKITLDNLETWISRTQIKGQPIDLLTLSACETATGTDRAALGLGGVAVKSGARSVVATLWSINDRATSILIPQMYEELQNNQKKSVSLRTAQLNLLNNKESPKYKHPFYWAPFVLIGDWQ